jgi:hypothetical protein
MFEIEVVLLLMPIRVLLPLERVMNLQEMSHQVVTHELLIFSKFGYLVVGLTSKPNQ